MLAPLLAAMVCATPVGAPRAVAAPHADAAAHVAAMSLPLDAGPASLMTELASLPELAAPASRADAAVADGAMTPATVDCVDTTPRPPAPDCMSGPASRWTDDMIGSCDLPRAGAARPAVLRRAHARTLADGVAPGSIGAAPEPLAPDHTPWSPLPGVAATLVHTLFCSAVTRAPDAAWPSPPPRRIDRPPRA